MSSHAASIVIEPPSGTTPRPRRPQAVVDMADLAPYANDRRIVGATKGPGAVRVAWDDGEVADFHPLWLRAECACLECRSRVTLERTFDHFGLPLDLDATAVEATGEGALRLVWSHGGHVSLFDPGWLWSRARPQADAVAPAPWGVDLAGKLPIFEHGAIMADDRALHAWLVALRDVGLALLHGVPLAAGEVERVARRISLPRDTNFGAIFDVITKPDANSNAYMTIELPGHVDLPSREYQPGFQFFHCLDNQATGGESTYVDGFALAEHLRREDRESFRLLCDTPIGFRFYDRVSDYVWRAPVIGLGPKGEVREIRFNPWLTEPLDVAPKRFAAVYGALRRFDDLTRDPRFQVRIRLAAGMMSAFDNRRVLHGRAAFDERGGRRHFQGCYVEREEVTNRIQVLERDL
ncbi:MAG: TauD/TfdA family dioxygenase [Geminicoccaceae bacterium]